MTHTEGAFLDWGYALAKHEFRNQIVTERETWILRNKEADLKCSVEDIAKMVNDGYSLMPEDQTNEVKHEVDEALELWDAHGNGQWKNKLLIKDTLTDIAMRSVITRPFDYDVIATMNLNGDYISDEIAALVGGIGIAPGANINYVTGHSIFEATHGTAPKYTDLDKVNPGFVVLSGEMMLRDMGWIEAAGSPTRGRRTDRPGSR